MKPQRNDIPGDIHTILKKDNKLWRSDKTNEKCLDFCNLGGKLWESKYMGKLMEDAGYFSKVCLCRFKLVPSQ